VVYSLDDSEGLKFVGCCLSSRTSGDLPSFWSLSVIGFDDDSTMPLIVDELLLRLSEFHLGWPFVVGLFLRLTPVV